MGYTPTDGQPHAPYTCCAGVTEDVSVQEDGRTLAEHGVRPGARLLVMRSAASQAVAALAAQEAAAATAAEHTRRLDRLKRSAEALAGRGDGR